MCAYFNVIPVVLSFFYLQNFDHCEGRILLNINVLRYTRGIDMWSLGCILGEMLLGKPLFPGSSTINQVERIMATLPPPTNEGNSSQNFFGSKEIKKEEKKEMAGLFHDYFFADLISVSAGYGINLLEKTPNGPRRTLKDLLPEVSEKALDLISNLIVFNPTQRLTAIEALEHPYVAEWVSYIHSIILEKLNKFNKKKGIY